MRQRNSVAILKQGEARRYQGVKGRALAFVGRAFAASQSDAAQQLGLFLVPCSVHPASSRATSSGHKNTREVRKEGMSAQRRDQGRIAAWGVAKPALVPNAATRWCNWGRTTERRQRFTRVTLSAGVPHWPFWVTDPNTWRTICHATGEIRPAIQGEHWPRGKPNPL